MLLIGLMILTQLVQGQNLTLKFEHTFDNQEVDFNNTYRNKHGEDLKFTTINYFISNISLKKTDGSYYTIPQDSSYFIVRHTPDTDQRTFTLSHLPEGEYTSVKFMIGVDSLRNTMSVENRRGNLDVGGAAKGMYWIWNSGYIFFKLEGISSVSTEKMKYRFTYHIGGFGGYKTKTINCIRELEIVFSPFKISTQKPLELTVNVGLEKFFYGHYDLKIAEKPNVMWGAESEKIADNYKEAFKAK